MQQQMTIEDLYPATWCGKTYQEPCQATVERTSEPSLKKQRGSQTRLPLFLDLRGSGATAGPSWEMGGALLGEYTMRSFGESPREDEGSRLSQILEEHPHPKYYLSDKACLGILNRAERRKKELPKELEEALRAQSASKNAPEDLGGGKGILLQNERTGALSTLAFEHTGAKAVWASEIEEFCIAVTKRRFPEDEADET